MGILNQNKTNTKTGKTITLPTMLLSDFENGFSAVKDGVDLSDVNRYVHNGIGVNTWNGQVFEGADGKEGYGSNAAGLTLNFAKLSDAIGAAKYDKVYTGSCENGRPIDVKQYTDASENDPKLRDKVVVTLDMKAIATANHEEKKEYAAAKGSAMPKDADRDRVPVKYTFTTTKNGVAGLDKEAVTNNIGKFAAQRYVLTASKSNPEQGMAEHSSVEKVANAYIDTYNSVMKDCIEGKCDKNMKTTGFNGAKKVEIEGTKVDKPNFDIKTMEIDGATVYAIDNKNGGVNTSDVNTWLRSVNNRVNKTFAQVVGSQFEKGSMECKLGNEVGANSYAVVPQDPKTGAKSGMILVQPAMQGIVKAYASKITDANYAATHQKPLGELYNDKIVENARTLADRYNKSSGSEGRTKDDAIKAVENQLAGIQAQLGD